MRKLGQAVSRLATAAVVAVTGLSAQTPRISRNVGPTRPDTPEVSIPLSSNDPYPYYPNWYQAEMGDVNDPTSLQKIKVIIIGTGIPDITYSDAPTDAANMPSVSGLPDNIPCTVYGDHDVMVTGQIGAPRNSEGIDGVSPDVTLLDGNMFVTCEDTDHTPGFALRIEQIFDLFGDDLTHVVVSIQNSDSPGVVSPENLKLQQTLIQKLIKSGAIVVTAAGNGGSAVETPGNLVPQAVVVSAIEPDLNLSGFSSYGPKTDICGPGRLTFPRVSADGKIYYVVDGVAGTSGASGFIAGVFARLWGAYPELTAHQVIELMRVTSRTSGVDPRCNWGIPNIERAESALRPYVKVMLPNGNVVDGAFVNSSLFNTIETQVEEENSMGTQMVLLPEAQDLMASYWLDNGDGTKTLFRGTVRLAGDFVDDSSIVIVVEPTLTVPIENDVYLPLVVRNY